MKLALAACFCICAIVLPYRGSEALPRTQPSSSLDTRCGCSYEAFARSTHDEQVDKACSVDCIFHSLDGFCNNVQYPAWGRADRRFLRLLQPDYCTTAGSAPRCAADGGPLPNARTLSVKLFQNKPARDLDRFLTSAHMIIGQFVTHDMGRRKGAPSVNAAGKVECGVSECDASPVCLPLQVLTGDPDFSPARCLRFLRSPSKKSPRNYFLEQESSATSYLDLHHVYGSSRELSAAIRDTRPGYSAFLNVTHLEDLGLPGLPGKPLLPQTDGVKCRGQTDVIKCFTSGTSQAGGNPIITAVHVIFLREHNRLVQELIKVNGRCWSQQRIFLEARKINIAAWQSIIYREYLPLLLSQQNLDFWDLRLSDYGYTNSYQPDLDATMSNVFMAASFRFGHSQIPPSIALAKPDFYIYENVSFSEAYDNPTLLYDSRHPEVTPVDALSLGMVALSAEATDPFFNKEITRSFDAARKGEPARDLEAIDIERGRDHGLPGYNAWRKWCFLPYATKSFSEFVDLSPAAQEALSRVYAHVEDVDVFVGGMLETPAAGDLTGPLLSCLNAEQFRRSRLGDRFWHEERPNGFTQKQLQNLRQVTMARLLCDNLDYATHMQPNVFAHPRSTAQALFGDVTSPWTFDLVYGTKLRSNNERVPCSSLPSLDLNLWRDPGCRNSRRCPEHKPQKDGY